MLDYGEATFTTSSRCKDWYSNCLAYNNHTILLSLYAKGTYGYLHSKRGICDLLKINYSKFGR